MLHLVCPWGPTVATTTITFVTTAPCDCYWGRETKREVRVCLSHIAEGKQDVALPQALFPLLLLSHLCLHYV